MQTLEKWCSKLSFRTGVIVIIFCILFYITAIIIPFIDLPKHIRGILLILFFGMAKTTQYIAVLIFGQEGIKWLKNKLKGKNYNEITDEKDEIIQDETEILNDNSSNTKQTRNNNSKDSEKYKNNN